MVLAAVPLVLAAATATSLFLGPSAGSQSAGVATPSTAVPGIEIDIVESSGDLEVRVSGFANPGLLEPLGKELPWGSHVSCGNGQGRISVLSRDSPPPLRYQLPARTELTDGFIYDHWFVEAPNHRAASQSVVSEKSGVGINISHSDSYLLLPPGYTSGADLSASSIYRSASLEDLYLNKGSYTYSWGETPGQSLTLNPIVS